MAKRTLTRRMQKFVEIILMFIFLLSLNLNFYYFSSFTKSYHSNLSMKLSRSSIPEAWYKGVIFKVPEIEGERKDWHDYVGMEADSYRLGLGENGNAVFEYTLKELKEAMTRKYGYNTFLSDLISINRSVPDVRHKICRSKHYLADLPTVSVIIACRNEYESVLKRTLHSIYNRTPRSLLKEIIIVDDSSEFGYSIDKMILYVKEQFPDLVKFIRLPERKGLIYAKQRGAKIAIGEVLVFLECHIECNYNWLPPLLDPIAVDDRISTSPMIDTIKFDDFLYVQHSAISGGFDWDLNHRLYLKHYKTDADKTKPYKNPIMVSGVLAISQRFFWELGGYDDRLDMEGPEQFEFSFKIWMCGGMLLVIPCSRIGRLSRAYAWQIDRGTRNYNSLATNNKRVAEVWMDEYKYYIYEDSSEKFANLDAGSLTEQHGVRKRLQCKSFKWYLEVIAHDTLENFPPNQIPDYAKGALQSVAYTKVCLDTLQGGMGSYVGVYTCHSNLIKPERTQYWHLNFRNEINNHRTNICLDQFEKLPNGKIHMGRCHGGGGNQFWSYNKRYKWVQHKKGNCLEIFKNEKKFSVIVNRCNKNNERMQWLFAYVNETAFGLQNVTF